MTQEEKSLLLQDLCARLPYGVKVQHQRQDYLEEIQTIEQTTRKYGEIETESVLGFVDDFKPYLRPMSSMTEEEEKEYSEIFWNRKADYIGAACIIDWLLEHHYDFRNLIERGLALEAPDGMYDLKDK